MSDVAIVVENLAKVYQIGRHERYRTLRDALTTTAARSVRQFRELLGMPSRRGDEPGKFLHWALRDLSFEVKRGETIGVIGRNGAGKSTLLKLLARITAPTAGRIVLRGRVGSLLEVGTGFHPELTGRENVYLNGAILGMSRVEIKQRFDEIVAFAEISDYLDTPVKRYSSGMQMRLAFSVAAHLNPEILLVDEVLAVGDVAFQRKCLGKMEEVTNQGRTVLFVSHNMAAVSSICSRGLLLASGSLVASGPVDGVIGAYLKDSNQVDLLHDFGRLGDGRIRFTAVEVRDEQGKVGVTPCVGSTIEIWLRYHVKRGLRVKNPTVGISVQSDVGAPVFLHHNVMTGDELGKVSGEGYFVCRLERLTLTPGIYRVTCSAMLNNEYLDLVRDALRLTVEASDFYGTGRLPPKQFGPMVVAGEWRREP